MAVPPRWRIAKTRVHVDVPAERMYPEVSHLDQKLQCEVVASPVMEAQLHQGVEVGSLCKANHRWLDLREQREIRQESEVGLGVQHNYQVVHSQHRST